MMILSTFKLAAMGALMGGLAVPALAANRDIQRPQAPRIAAPESAPDVHSRRVELPFPLEFRPAESEPPRPARPQSSPHPSRMLQPEAPLRADLHRGFGVTAAPARG